jgi:hypothetical protein
VAPGGAALQANKGGAQGRPPSFSRRMTATMSPAKEPGESSRSVKRPARRPARRARLRSPGQLWGRRSVLAGLALIALAIIGGIVLLVDGDGDGDSEESAAQRLLSERQGELTESLDDAKTGIAVNWPSSWEKLEKRGAFGFRSPDRDLLISISAPAPSGDADALREGAIDQVRREYGEATVQRGKGRTIGGLTATGAIVQGPNSTTLVAVAPGKERAYLFQVLTRPDVAAETLVDGQLILGSLELSK